MATIQESFLSLALDAQNNAKKCLQEIEVIVAYLQGQCDGEKVKMSSEEEMTFKGKTIFKTKSSKTYYTRYRQDGKQYYISGKTQKEVMQKLKTALNYTPKKHNTTTLTDWYNKWLELFKIGKVKEATLIDYRQIMKWIPTNIASKDIKSITSIEINEMLNNIPHERVRQKVYELLKALFGKAVDYEIVKKNILSIIDKPKHVREKGVALSYEEQEIFIQACLEHKYGDLFLIAIYQGLRIGEVLAITGDDIDITKRELHINKAINFKEEFDTTKNTQSCRIMPIFNNTLPILQKYKDYGSSRIFNITHCTAQSNIRELSSKLNIRNITMHDLRHTFITNCKNKNIPEHIIQSWVGHTIGSSVTSKIYTHVNTFDTKKYVEMYDNKGQN